LEYVEVCQKENEIILFSFTINCKMKLSDIDLDADLRSGKDRMHKTQQQYYLWLCRFSEICD
jgi:hypothetical protein